MGATEEQMQLLSDAGVDHISYLLMLYSIAFLLYLCESHSFESKCYLANLNNSRQHAPLSLCSQLRACKH
jgi:hypothetical protein